MEIFATINIKKKSRCPLHKTRSMASFCCTLKVSALCCGGAWVLGYVQMSRSPAHWEELSRVYFGTSLQSALWLLRSVCDSIFFRLNISSLLEKVAGWLFFLYQPQEGGENLRKKKSASSRKIENLDKETFLFPDVFVTLLGKAVWGRCAAVHFLLVLFFLIVGVGVALFIFIFFYEGAPARTIVGRYKGLEPVKF